MCTGEHTKSFLLLSFCDDVTFHSFYPCFFFSISYRFFCTHISFRFMNYHRDFFSGFLSFIHQNRLHRIENRFCVFFLRNFFFGHSISSIYAHTFQCQVFYSFNKVIFDSIQYSTHSHKRKRPEKPAPIHTQKHECVRTYVVAYDLCEMVLSVLLLLPVTI